MTESGVDGAGVFHKIPRIDDSRPAVVSHHDQKGLFSYFFLLGEDLETMASQHF